MNKPRLAQKSLPLAALALAACWFAASSPSLSAAATPPAAPNAPPAPQAADDESHNSLTDRSIDWPSWPQWRRVLLLEDYNSRIVILGTSLLGAAAGMVGSFTLLRRRALMGDALSHATLPGIALAFILTTSWGGSGKSLAALLFGATLTGSLGVASILLIRNLTRIKEDAALGIVLSVFFGAGVALMGIVQQTEQGHAAGLEAFIYGKTASMGARDATLIGSAALACTIVCTLLFKELKLLCFDDGFAGAKGMPVIGLDVALMALVVAIAIVGLQAVGLILMVALLVIPAASARFWTERLFPMTCIAAALGAVGGMGGAAMSAVFSRLPSGAMIVLVCTLFFGVSLVFGAQRGVLIRRNRRARLNRRVGRQHLLRALYETLESQGNNDLPSNRCDQPATLAKLLLMRSWTPAQLDQEIKRAERDHLLRFFDDRRVCLTESGWREAAHATRQHRLWELYLIEHAEIAPSRVDRDADDIEHVLDSQTIAQLASLLDQQVDAGTIPDSPHALEPSEAAQPGGATN